MTVRTVVTIGRRWVAGVGRVVGIPPLEAKIGRLGTGTKTLLVVRVVVIRQSGTLGSLARRLVAPSGTRVLADANLQALLGEYSGELGSLCNSVSICLSNNKRVHVLCIPGNFLAE